ncbi:MAG: antibiotic biosynthesis monooxygenase [Acidimicrobiia bacterium]|nr:antibiotic biosynthesis monooxygenase [Acidimicrobiia bacterium]
MSEITIVASIHAATGHEDDVEAALEVLIEATHREPGCLRYVLHRHHDDPARFVLIEHWQDQVSLDTHFQAEHMAAFMTAVAPWLEGGSVVHVLEPLPKGDATKGRL